VADGLWNIRPAVSGDSAFMADMLVKAVNWSPEWKKQSRRRVLSTRKTAHYIAGWPRDTDLGLIAEADRERIGAAWLRFHPALAAGIRQISLSVERKNFARKLYLSEGYQIVGGDRDSDTMLKDLAAPLRF
jgi:hypothetical protein